MIMHSVPVPVEGRYGMAIEIMRWMGWDWRALIDAPSDLVEEIAFRMFQDSKWTAERRKLDAQMR